MKQMKNSASLRRPRAEPRLVFAPLAWLKLAFFCHLGDTEIGGFGISAKDNLLYVEEFATLKQEVSIFSVRFLDDAVADHFDGCLERGIIPSRCGRLWIHTHPGDSALPSSTDEETFARSFGACDWAVMMILARSGETYARLAFAAGPKAHLEMSVHVDWSAWHDCVCQGQPSLDVLFAQWLAEYQANIHLRPAAPPATTTATSATTAQSTDPPWWHEEHWYLPLDPFDPYPEEYLSDEFLDHSGPGGPRSAPARHRANPAPG